MHYAYLAIFPSPPNFIVLCPLPLNGMIYMKFPFSQGQPLDLWLLDHHRLNRY